MVQAHGMSGWNEVTFFLTLLTCATPGTAASNIIIAKTQ